MGGVAKGYYTQGVAVLLKDPVDVKHLKRWLDGFTVVDEAEGDANPYVRGPFLEIEFQPELGARIEVDLVAEPWPDAMMGLRGDEATSTLAETSILTECVQGFFGPFCSPGALKRACQFCHLWPEASEVLSQHKAFLRVRSSYADEDEPVGSAVALPRGYKVTEECEFVLGVVESLLGHPQALGYFNPNGEVVASPKAFSQVSNHCHKASIPALTLLANRRQAKIAQSDWTVIDTVGLAQLDLVDLELGVGPGYSLQELQQLLVSTPLDHLRSGLRFKDGHTLSGPEGKLYEGRHFSESLLPASRSTFRLRPRDGTISPPELGFGDKPFGRSAWWQFWKL